jgi:hypothetical protein
VGQQPGAHRAPDGDRGEHAGGHADHCCGNDRGLLVVRDRRLWHRRHAQRAATSNPADLGLDHCGRGACRPREQVDARRAPLVWARDRQPTTTKASGTIASVTVAKPVISIVGSKVRAPGSTPAPQARRRTMVLKLRGPAKHLVVTERERKTAGLEGVAVNDRQRDSPPDGENPAGFAVRPTPAIARKAGLPPRRGKARGPVWRQQGLGPCESC